MITKILHNYNLGEPLINSSITKWALSNSQLSQFNTDSWTTAPGASTLDIPQWKSPTYHKILGHQLPSDLDINKTIILGGICSIFTAEIEQIRNKKIVFKDIDDFERWIYSWYPRIDQVHDTVGIPPMLCPKIVYVCEDSFFAKRIAAHTGLPKNQIQNILRQVHIAQGHRVVLNWCRSFGYKRDISVVYTSDLEKELRIGVKFFERLLGHSFQNNQKEFAAVKLMYTAIWLDILEIKDFGVIYEPANHIYHPTQILRHWAINNQFGSGFNHNLGIIGYVPFWTASGLSRFLPLEQVPNYGNYNTFNVSASDLPWYTINILFTNKEVLANDPTAICNSKANYLIKSILQDCYSVDIG